MRSERGAVWAYLLLSVSLLGALSFGAYQTKTKNQFARDAENKYMSAFHKLKWTSENIEERTAKLMATNDPHLQQGLLSDLRVFSAQAVEHMSVLPLMTTTKPRIESFLNTAREQSDLLHAKLNRGGALSDEDWSRLMELRKQSVFFENELANILGLVGSGMIRWQDTVRVTGPSQTGETATPITKSVAMLDQALQAPPGEEQAMSPNAGPLARPRTDPGPRVDQARAIEAVKRFVDMPVKGEPVVTGVSDPEDQFKEFSLYFVEAVKENDLKFSFGVSVHGGHVLYMLDGRAVTEKKFTEAQLVERATGMLEKRGYRGVQFISAAENDGTLVMDFAPMQNGVPIHVDMIKIMLAMDNGELLGFDGRSFWTNRYARTLPQPALSAAQAVQRVSPRLKPEGQPRMAVVADRRFQEKLTWEVRGRVDDQRFRVYVDAQTGQEVDIQRVSGDPAPPLNEGG